MTEFYFSLRPAVNDCVLYAFTQHDNTSVENALAVSAVNFTAADSSPSTNAPADTALADNAAHNTITVNTSADYSHGVSTPTNNFLVDKLDVDQATQLNVELQTNLAHRVQKLLAFDHLHAND